MRDAMAAPSLFSDTDIRSFLGLESVDSARAAMAERLTWGEIKGALRPLLQDPATRPAPVDETVFSIALQIGAILYENPTAISGTTTGSDSTQYDRQRVADLHAQLEVFVAEESGASVDGVAKPRGRFPKAQPYPDPARGRCRGLWADPGDRYTW